VITALLWGLGVWLLLPKNQLKPLKQTKKLQPTWAAAALAVGIWVLNPTMVTAAAAIATFLLLPKLIAKLPSKNQQQQHRQIEQELDLTIDLIAAALAAGLSVLSALDAVSKVVQPKLGAELTAAANRLQWGADLEQAFSFQLQPISAALGRAMDHGVGAAKALSEIAARTREQRKQELLRRSKKLSVTLALPVALLMLPGFVLLGVVPMVIPALSSFL
jgi:Flp pilus assembly protein TadB